MCLQTHTNTNTHAPTYRYAVSKCKWRMCAHECPFHMAGQLAGRSKVVSARSSQCRRVAGVRMCV